MTESYRDKLNEIDHKCLDEDLKFYDLRSLFESVAPKLSAEDKEEIKKVIQNTNDAETIAAVLQAKAMDEKNESLEESSEDAISREQYEKEREELANKFDELRRNNISSSDYRYKSLLKKEKELNKLGREVKAQEIGGVVFNKAKLTNLIKKLTGLDTLKTHSTAIRGYHNIGSGSFTIEQEGQNSFRLSFYRNRNIQDEVKTKLIDLGFKVSEFGGDLLIDDIQIPRNESLEERYDFDLVDNAIDHFLYDLGREPEVDDVIEYIENTSPEEVPEDFDKYQKWADDISCEISARLSESLEEKLIDAPQEVVDELINILNKHGFVLDDSFKVNPGKTFMGAIHLQVINPESVVEDSDEIDVQDELQKYVTRELIDDIHKLDRESNCPITWNFGPNKNGQVTGGLDIMKQWIEESLDISDYEELTYPLKDGGKIISSSVS